MRSSARQLEFEGLFTTSRIDEASSDFHVASFGGSTSDTIGASAPTVDFPDFSGRREAFALTSRMAGRINAANVSESEYRKLLAERQLLVDKELEENLSKKERCRLALVRWSLDRIEDAKYGLALDVLEDRVRAYEKLAIDIASLTEQIEKLSNRRKKYD